MTQEGAPPQKYSDGSGTVIGACIEVHRQLGPGLLESVYEQCLCHELWLRGVRFRRQISVPVFYKDLLLDCGYRVDLVVEGQLVVELKSVERLLPIQVPVQSAVGAGDCMVAAIALGLVRGLALLDAVRCGLAAGAATRVSAGPERCRRAAGVRRSAAVLVWNYHDDDLPAPASDVLLTIEGLPAGRPTVTHYRVDQDLSNAYTVWKSMGSPATPSASQKATLEKAGELQLFDPPQRMNVQNGRLVVSFSLPRQGVSLVKVVW